MASPPVRLSKPRPKAVNGVPVGCMGMHGLCQCGHGGTGTGRSLAGGITPIVAVSVLSSG